MLTPTELDIIKNPKLQKLFRKKMGFLEEGEMFIDYKIIEMVTTVDDSYYDVYPKEKSLYVPDTVSRDSSRPERGLWGMINWEQIGQISFERDGTLFIQLMNGEWLNGTITEACLKALEFQVEQEGK